MAYQIVIKKRFSNKVIKVLFYLEIEWSQQAAEAFLLKVDRRIDLLKKQPEIGGLSGKNKRSKGLVNYKA